jgi:hypothetical protein
MSAGANPMIFWPILLSCMHKCIHLLVLRFLWGKVQNSALLAAPLCLISVTIINVTRNRAGAFGAGSINQNVVKQLDSLESMK